MAELKRTNPGAAAATAVPVRHAAGNADVVAAAGQRAAQRRAQSAQDMGNAIARLGGAVEQFAAGRAAGYAADAKADYQLMRDAQDLSLARKQSEVQEQSIRRTGEQRKEAEAARRQAEEEKIRKAQEQLEKADYAADRRAVMNAGAAQFNILQQGEDVLQLIHSPASDDVVAAAAARLANNATASVVSASCVPAGEEGSNGIGVRNAEKYKPELVREVSTTYAPKLLEYVMTERAKLRINRHVGKVGENLKAMSEAVFVNGTMPAEEMKKSLRASGKGQLDGYMSQEEIDKIVDTIWTASVAKAYEKEGEDMFSVVSAAMTRQFETLSATGDVDDEWALKNAFERSEKTIYGFYLNGEGEERGLHGYFSREDREKMARAQVTRLSKARDALKAQTNKEQLADAVNYINLSADNFPAREAMSVSQKTVNLYSPFFAGSAYGDARASGAITERLTEGTYNAAPDMTEEQEKELFTLLKNDLMFTDMRTADGRAHACKLLTAARLMKPQRFDAFRIAFSTSLNDAAQNKSGSANKDEIEAELAKNGITNKRDVVALMPAVKTALKANPSQFDSLTRSICDEYRMRKARAEENSNFEDMVFSDLTLTGDADAFIYLRGRILEN